MLESQETNSDYRIFLDAPVFFLVGEFDHIDTADVRTQVIPLTLGSDWRLRLR